MMMGGREGRGGKDETDNSLVIQLPSQFLPLIASL